MLIIKIMSKTLNAGMNSGVFDALIDGDITFDAIECKHMESLQVKPLLSPKLWLFLIFYFNKLLVNPTEFCDLTLYSMHILTHIC